MTENAVKAEVENLSEVKRKLSIAVPAAEVTGEVDRAYRELGKQAKVKGFRPGKVPRSVLEMYYHKQINEEVSEALVRRSLAVALKEKDLEAVNLTWPEPPPAVVAGQDYRYSVEIEVTPKFELQDYRGLELSAAQVEVADAEVEARLEEVRQQNALVKPPKENRPIQAGDFVVHDYQAYFAGEPAEAGKAEGTYVEVGSGKFNAEFEKNLVGLMEGAESRFAVDLPNDFANPLLAGKAVEFQVKIQEVKEKVVADLDDNFAKALGGNFQTLDALREAVREDIIKGKERERQAILENQVHDQLISRHPFELPPSLVNQEQENLFREQWERYSQYGIDPAKMDHTKLLEALKPMAERRARIKILLERIAEQEGLSVDDAEVEATLARIAVHSGKDVAEVRKFYQERDLTGALKKQLRAEKSLKLLLDEAKVSDAPQAAPAQVNIGGNKFESVPIPLSFEDRYFLVESGDQGHIFTVVTVSNDMAVVEVLKNEPKDNPLTTVTKTIPGIITVSDPETGSFIYKIRPGSKSSTIFGKIKGEEQEMQISDRQIKIGTNVFERNMITGLSVGIMVQKDGSIAMGVSQLPIPIMKWLQETTIPEANE